MVAYYILTIYYLPLLQVSNSTRHTRSHKFQLKAGSRADSSNSWNDRVWEEHSSCFAGKILWAHRWSNITRRKWPPKLQLTMASKSHWYSSTRACPLLNFNSQQHHLWTTQCHRSWNQGSIQDGKCPPFHLQPTTWLWHLHWRAGDAVDSRTAAENRHCTNSSEECSTPTYWWTHLSTWSRVK